MIISIEKISPINDDKLDYNLLIFRIVSDKIINHANSGELSSLLNSLVNGGVLKIIINLKDLSHIDSSGIGMLIKYAKVIRKNGGDIALTNVSKETGEIFSVINLQKFFQIYKTEVEAVNAFRYVSP